MYDAAVGQEIYHYSNEQLGGFSGTVEKMLEADPNFAMGHIFQLGLENFGNCMGKSLLWHCLTNVHYGQ